MCVIILAFGSLLSKTHTHSIYSSHTCTLAHMHAHTHTHTRTHTTLTLTFFLASFPDLHPRLLKHSLHAPVHWKWHIFRWSFTYPGFHIEEDGGEHWDSPGE